MNDPSSEGRAGAADVSSSQHVMVCALKELGSLVQSLSATASPLIQEPSVGRKAHLNTLCCIVGQKTGCQPCPSWTKFKIKSLWMFKNYYLQCSSEISATTISVTNRNVDVSTNKGLHVSQNQTSYCISTYNYEN